MAKSYLLYRITNLINGKIYVGVHSTEDPNDGYMGSGRTIQNAIKKYGIENFKKEILEFLESEETMYLAEAKIVNSEFINRRDTYNEVTGGRGWKAYFRTMAKTLWITNGIVHQRIAENDTPPVGWRLGRAATPAKGSKWVTNGIKSKRIPRENSLPNGWWGESRQNRKPKFWITDGSYNKAIDSLDDIPEGWAQGRLLPPPPNKGIKYRRITNGIKNKMIPEVASPPDGWYYGMAGFPAKVG
jgi:hypothetical protein